MDFELDFKFGYRFSVCINTYCHFLLLLVRTYSNIILSSIILSIVLVQLILFPCLLSGCDLIRKRYSNSERRSLVSTCAHQVHYIVKIQLPLEILILYHKFKFFTL